MEKFLKLLPWLDSAQAVTLLESLTGSPLTADTLRHLCAAGNLPAYVDCSGLKGEEYEGSCRRVCGDGPQKLERPERLTIDVENGLLYAQRPLVSGPAWVYESSEQPPSFKDLVWWNVGDIWSSPLVVIIKPVDIQVLVEIINGNSLPSAEALACDLRSQLEAERRLRESATQRAEQAEAKASMALESAREAKSIAQINKEQAAEANMLALRLRESWNSALASEQQARQQLDAIARSRAVLEERLDHAQKVNSNILAANNLADDTAKTNSLELRAKVEALTKALAEAQAQARTIPAEQESKPSHLLAISALIELLLEQNRPRYNQSSVIEAIVERHPDWRGTSESQLTKLFAIAKAAAKEAEKKAQAKLDARQAAANRP